MLHLGSCLCSVVWHLPARNLPLQTRHGEELLQQHGSWAKWHISFLQILKFATLLPWSLSFPASCLLWPQRALLWPVPARPSKHNRVSWESSPPEKDPGCSAPCRALGQVLWDTAASWVNHLSRVKQLHSVKSQPHYNHWEFSHWLFWELTLQLHREANLMEAGIESLFASLL